MLFLALSPDDKRALIIRADAGHDARRFAEVLFADVVDRDRILVHPTEDVGQRVDFELKWEGHDAGAKPNKHLQVRAFNDGIWGKWKRVS